MSKTNKIKVTVSGATGTGKSTIINLLVRALAQSGFRGEIISLDDGREQHALTDLSPHAFCDRLNALAEKVEVVIVEQVEALPGLLLGAFDVRGRHD